MTEPEHELRTLLNKARAHLPVCPECGSQRVELVGTVAVRVSLFDGVTSTVNVFNDDTNVDISQVKCLKCKWHTEPVFRQIYSDGAQQELNGTPFMRIWDKKDRTWKLEYSLDEVRPVEAVHLHTADPADEDHPIEREEREARRGLPCGSCTLTFDTAADLAAHYAGTHSPVALLGPNTPPKGTIEAITTRKAAGTDCDQDESAVVIRAFDTMPESDRKALAELFPLEYEQWRSQLDCIECGMAVDKDGNCIEPGCDASIMGS